MLIKNQNPINPVEDEDKNKLLCYKEAGESRRVTQGAGEEAGKAGHPIVVSRF